jgi:hypothetical protein
VLGEVRSLDLPRGTTGKSCEHYFCPVREGDGDPPRTLIDSKPEDVQYIDRELLWNSADMKTALADRQDP